MPVTKDDALDYYTANAEKLYHQYQSLKAERVHASWLKHLPSMPGIACDIGAGSGRDANWLAALGWEVIAVEPSASLLTLGKDASAGKVTWLDDKLPDLGKLRTIGHRFNLILLSAVWMHLPSTQRERAFRILSEMLMPGGLIVITLRHGSDASENSSRHFYPVNAEELQHFAKLRALACIHHDSQQDQLGRNKGLGKVEWETLVFQLPDDGTGNLPLLRHIIVNDDKSATYKLGLLRALIRIADGAPGMVLARNDDWVELPFGLVGLYWLKLYIPLVLQHRLIQAPSHKPEQRKGLGFAKQEHFYQLANLSTFDLRIGATLSPENASLVTGAIRDACVNIQRMPAHHTTYPGTQKAVFECSARSTRFAKGHWLINKESLGGFGTFRVPAKLWQTLGQYACWLEPAILNEWTRLMMSYEIRYDRSVYDKALEWEEGRRDTTLVRSRVENLLQAGNALRCVWTDARLGSHLYQIDHCFPWSRWFNNDLWNLMPASSTANSQKGEKLPSASLMHEARTRILGWWQDAFLESSLHERFYMEAEAALPLIGNNMNDVESVFEAMLHQRAKIKMNQQLMEWK